MASSADSPDGRILVIVRCHAGPQTSNQPLTLSLADQDTGVDATERQETTTDRQTVRSVAQLRDSDSINQSIKRFVGGLSSGTTASTSGLIEHVFTSAPTQYRLYGRRFLQV